MKKWLSMALVCSLLVTGISYGSTKNVAKAEEGVIGEQTESVTDLDAYENNDLIVVYKNKSMTEKKMTAKTVDIGDLTEENETEVLTDNSVIVKFENREDLEAAIEEYSENSLVAYVQPNYIYHTLDHVTITDTDYGKQWGLNNDGTYSYTETVYVPSQTTGWYGGGYTTQKQTITAEPDIDVNAPEAWSLGTGANREVVVAFVDTGIKYDHEELEGCMWVNTGEIAGDGIDNDHNGYVDDIHGWNFYAADETNFWKYWPGFGFGFGNGNNSSDNSNGNNTYYNANSQDEDSHATHCAGIVAAQENGIGIVGIASRQNVKIMTVKVLGGSNGEGTTESVVKGIQYAADNGADICNLSLGGEDDDQILRDVIEKNSDVLFCIAAGNGDANNYQGYDMDAKGAVKEYPACYQYDNIITVANVQCDGELHYTSNYGSTSVDIAAPGTEIYSTSTITAGYEYMTGTSMATPMVSGVAALLYSYYDDVTIYDVKDMILNSAKKISSLDGKVVCGGMVDAYAALKEGRPSETASVPPASTPTAAAETKEPIGTEKPAETEEPEETAEPIPTITSVIVPTKEPTGEPQSTVMPSPTDASATTEPTAIPTLGTSSEEQLDSSVITLTTGKKSRLAVYHIPDTVDVIWKSSDTSVATVGKKGLVTAKLSGKTKITATLDSGEELSCVVVVKPLKPTSVKAIQLKKKLKVTISWAKVTGVDGYQILRATSQNGKYKTIKTITKQGTKSYTDSKVAKKTYYYKVRAYKTLSSGKKVYSVLSSPYKVTVKK